MLKGFTEAAFGVYCFGCGGFRGFRGSRGYGIAQVLMQKRVYRIKGSRCNQNIIMLVRVESFCGSAYFRQTSLIEKVWTRQTQLKRNPVCRFVLDIFEPLWR